MVSTTNRTAPPPPKPVESNYEESNESEDEDDDIEFVSDESDVNDGVEDEVRLHSFDELHTFWGSFSCWTPNKVRKDDAFQ